MKCFLKVLYMKVYIDFILIKHRIICITAGQCRVDISHFLLIGRVFYPQGRHGPSPDNAHTR